MTKQKRSLFKDVLYSVGFGVLIIYAIWVFGGSSHGKILGVDQVYEVVEDKNVLIDVGDCKLPNEQVGLRCCKRDDEFLDMCTDEADTFLKEYENAEEVSEGSRVYLPSLSVSYLEPVGYYVIKDKKTGGINNPYYYFAVDDAGVFIIEINVGDFSDIFAGTTIKDGFEEYKRGLEEGLKSAAELNNAKILMRDDRVIKTKNGYDASVHEFRIQYPELDPQYTKMVVLMDKPLMLFFKTTDDYANYVSDFDDLLNSIEFN